MSAPEQIVYDSLISYIEQSEDYYSDYLLLDQLGLTIGECDINGDYHLSSDQVAYAMGYAEGASID